MPIKDPELKRKYHREWMAKRRAEYFKDKYCVQCNSTQNLELDHIDRKTKEHHAIWSWSQVRREAELAKCQVLCRECHLQKTKKEHSMVRGSQTSQAKLTEENARKIKEEYQSGISGIELATKYGINKSNIYRLLRGETWTHI